MAKKILTLILIISSINLLSQIEVDSLKFKGYDVLIIHGTFVGHEYTSTYYDHDLVEYFERTNESHIRGEITMDSVKSFVHNKGYFPQSWSTCYFNNDYKSFSVNEVIVDPFSDSAFPPYRLNINSYKFDLYHILAINYYDSLVTTDPTDWESLLSLTKCWISYFGQSIKFVKDETIKPSFLINKVLLLNPKSVEANLIKAELHHYASSIIYFNQSKEKRLCKKSIKKTLKLDPTNERALRIRSEIKEKSI